MKNCLDCGIDFEPRGRNHKRCDDCSINSKKFKSKTWYYEHKVLGSGSGAKLFEDGGTYKHGMCVFKRWAKQKLKQLDYHCERCGKFIDVTVRGMWAGHHKDHNRNNNIQDNLEILCKQCHQIEHECWRVLQGVTTIPEGSTQETVEAHSIHKYG